MAETMEEFITRVERKEPTAGQGPQGSAAWLFERVGYCTASRFDDVVARTKAGKPTAEREKYLWEVVVEQLTGKPSDHFTSGAMQWGSDNEMPSRMAAEAANGYIIEEVGFIKHPTLKMVGGSPDGLIGDDGGWESKSPFNSAVHLATILNGMPTKHMAQVQGLMWLTGRKWWDFQSYDPRLPAPLNRYQQRIQRNEKYIAILEEEVITFTAEVSAMVLKLEALKETEPTI